MTCIDLITVHNADRRQFKNKMAAVVSKTKPRKRLHSRWTTRPGAQNFYSCEKRQSIWLYSLKGVPLGFRKRHRLHVSSVAFALKSPYMCRYPQIVKVHFGFSICAYHRVYISVEWLNDCLITYMIYQTKAESIMNAYTHTHTHTHTHSHTHTRAHTHTQAYTHTTHTRTHTLTHSHTHTRTRARTRKYTTHSYIYIYIYILILKVEDGTGLRYINVTDVSAPFFRKQWTHIQCNGSTVEGMD
jgi:hypothetical protein